MKTYKAFATLPNIGQTPVTIEARSTYEAKEKLEALYGKGNVHESIRGVARDCMDDRSRPKADLSHRRAASGRWLNPGPVSPPSKAAKMTRA
jgi:hypothetical protein